MRAEFLDVGLSLEIKADVVAFDKDPGRRGGSRGKASPFVERLLFPRRRVAAEVRAGHKQHQQSELPSGCASQERMRHLHLVFRSNSPPAGTNEYSGWTEVNAKPRRPFFRRH